MRRIRAAGARLAAQPEGDHARGPGARRAARRPGPMILPFRTPAEFDAAIPTVAAHLGARAAARPIPPKPSTASARPRPCRRCAALARLKGRAPGKPFLLLVAGRADGRRRGGWCSPPPPARCRTRSGPARSRSCCGRRRAGCPTSCAGARADRRAPHVAHRASRGWWRAAGLAADLDLRQPARRSARAGPRPARRAVPAGEVDARRAAGARRRACSATSHRRRWSTAPSSVPRMVREGAIPRDELGGPPGGSRRDYGSPA